MTTNGATRFTLANPRAAAHNERAFDRSCRRAMGTFAARAALMSDDTTATLPLDFEALVDRYYRPLYQFAFSLTRSEADACDLTQQTFYAWARKGHQLRDASKVKTWLFTTLHREFLKLKRRETRFPHQEISQTERELPAISPEVVNELDSATALDALEQVDELHRAPLVLFYLEDHSYKEIAEILEIPIGTVQSRIARGKAQLQRLLLSKEHRG
jgi:RNA polymerase sigma factor (sigma-70 family)